MTSGITARPLRLGVNIDHVATVRNARGGAHPDPVRAALLAAEAGADGITAHLREDRRHIGDGDVERLVAELAVPLNLEMAVTEEMVAVARRLRPHAACLVPERRSEVTTEGGLDAAGAGAALGEAVAALSEAGCRVSLFIDPDPRQVEAARRVGAPVVEFHTGTYREAPAGTARAAELERLRRAAALAHGLGVECHAGHGLSYATARPVAAIPEVIELNIGHFLVGEAVFLGLAEAIRRMREVMDAGRRDLARPKVG
jgi:pyridoxine 5-phosphate synthase